MDHITRCPNCSTAFRVTDEQLSAFQGKVRCGRCALVFNAHDSMIQHLQAQTEITKPAEPAPDTTQTEETASLSVSKINAASSTHQLVWPEEENVTDKETTPQLAEQNAETSATPIESTEIHSSDAATTFEAEVEIEAEQEAPMPFTTSSSENHIEDVWSNDHDTQTVETDFSVDIHADKQTESSFTNTPTEHIASEEKQPQITFNQAVYQPIAHAEDEALFAPIVKKPRSRVWGLLVVVVLFALALQLIYFYRVRIVMEFPALQTRFAAVCQTLHCDMPLPRQSDQLRLEWSELTFVPEQPTRIQLSATLRNLALYEQALPKMELTLTDKLEGVVARRVFQADEYLVLSEKSRKSLAAYDELHVFVELDIGALKSTGYSLYWFYD